MRMPFSNSRARLLRAQQRVELELGLPRVRLPLRAADVARDGRQIRQQRPETVQRRAIGGPLRGFLALRAGRRLRRRHRIPCARPGGELVVGEQCPCGASQWLAVGSRPRHVGA